MEQDRKNESDIQERDSVYSDAYYRQVPEERRSCYGYSPAQCYAHAAEERAPEPEKSRRKHTGVGALITLICAIFVLTASLFISSGMLLSQRSSAAAATDASTTEIYAEYSAAADSDDDSGTLFLSRSAADGTDPLSAEEIYTTACDFTVGVTIPGYAYNIFGQSSASSVMGTGVILSEDGYVLTNFHVIETAYDNGADIMILTYEGDEYIADVVGVETDSDLAVLKIDADGLTPAVLGDSDEMRVGQTIYTVGNPLGELTYTMTSGIISALDRRITTDENITVNMFQIDAAVNSGNSGGPVFNVYGQVIGIVTAKYSLYGMEGLGFAIPINDACRITNDLVEKGYVTGKAYLGLQFANVTASVARYYDMVQGVYVYTVEPGSCSEAAGLETGDIIVAIDGKTVTTSTDLAMAIREYRAGDSAELSVWRSKEIIEVTVVFDEELPAEHAEQIRPSSELPSGKS